MLFLLKMNYAKVILYQGDVRCVADQKIRIAELYSLREALKVTSRLA